LSVPENGTGPFLSFPGGTLALRKKHGKAKALQAPVEPQRFQLRTAGDTAGLAQRARFCFGRRPSAVAAEFDACAFGTSLLSNLTCGNALAKRILSASLKRLMTSQFQASMKFA
jgi:hypothetical protein